MAGARGSAVAFLRGAIMRINIEPIPCPRPRIMSRGKFAHAYYPKEYKQWRERFLEALPLSWVNLNLATPVSVYVEFVVRRPKTTKLLTPRGDIDNYQKSLFDALTDAKVWDDDTLVDTVKAKKRFTKEGEEPHITLEIGTSE